jgi:hypothetical protein
MEDHELRQHHVASRSVGEAMTKELIEYLAPIEVADTSAALERIQLMKEQAKREVEEETKKELKP